LGKTDPTQLIVEGNRTDNETASKVAELFNTNRTYFNEAKKLKDNKPELFEEVKSGQKTITEVKKEENLKLKKQRENEESKQNLIEEPIIIHADCMDIFDRIPDIDLLIADPPYFTDGNFVEQVSKYFTKVKPTGQAYVFMSADPSELIAYLNMDRHNLNLIQVLIWNYNNTGQRQPNVRYNSNYQICFYFRGADAPDINKPADGKEQYACQTVNAPDARRDERYFKWQKPDELIARYIKNSSKVGDFVFDPFAGSGTTLIVASGLGRSSMGCDIDKDMIDICIKRGCKNEQF
jgi:DNA modification methylase